MSGISSIDTGTRICSNAECGRRISPTENRFVWFGDVFCWDCYLGNGIEIFNCSRPKVTTP